MDKENPSPEAELKTLATNLKTATDEVKSFAEKATAEMKNLGKVTEETKASADKALTGMNDLSARLTELEQKSVRKGGEPVEMKSLGQMVSEDAGYKAWVASGADKSYRAKMDVDIKTVNNLTSGTTTVGAGTSGSTSLVPADRLSTMVMLPDRRLVVRDLISQGNTQSAVVEYAQQTAQQNLAAVVAEGAAKPQSDLTFNLVKSSVTTIATYMKASRQILDDAPQLQSVVDNRLRFMLSYVEEAELLNGDGTGVHLLGIIPQATAYAAPFVVTDETAIDRLRLAMLQATIALYPASGVVLHPTDWTKIEMQKDGMGRYIIGDPYNQTTPRLWGLPVVPSLSMTAGTFLTGAFKVGAQIFDRMGVEVLLSTEDSTNFTTNLVTIRGEERLALAVYTPGAFITGTLP